MASPTSKYVWPASAITHLDMELLHAARESSRPRVPISELIARAVRRQYRPAGALADAGAPEAQHAVSP